MALGRHAPLAQTTFRVILGGEHAEILPALQLGVNPFVCLDEPVGQ